MKTIVIIILAKIKTSGCGGFFALQRGFQSDNLLLIISVGGITAVTHDNKRSQKA
ncbi:hypothetical protein ACMV8I_05855 [Ewingella sp. S1.OA.A_B6]